MEKYPNSTHYITFQDCDALGHLNNARYLDYFINAREGHLRSHYQVDASKLLAEGKGWVVTGHEIAYLRPANLYEMVNIRTALIQFDAQQIMVEHLMTNEAGTQLKSLMWTKYAFFNAQTARREPAPTYWLDLMEKVGIRDIPVASGFQARIESLMFSVKNGGLSTSQV